MSTVSQVFHTLVTVRLISKMQSGECHPFYKIWYPCFKSRASGHSITPQATQGKQNLLTKFKDIWIKNFNSYDHCQAM